MNSKFSSFSGDDKMMPNVQDPKGGTIPDINKTKEGITKLLKNLAPLKTSETDMISARFLKESADKVAKALALIFQQYLHKANIPNEW